LQKGKYIKQTGGKGSTAIARSSCIRFQFQPREQKRVSTDDLDLLAKQVVAAARRQVEIRQGTPVSVIARLRRSDSARVYRPIEAGIREALITAFWAGFPMVDVAAVLIDGSYTMWTAMKWRSRSPVRWPSGSLCARQGGTA